MAVEENKNSVFTTGEFYDNFVVDKDMFPTFESFTEFYEGAKPEDVYGAVDKEVFTSFEDFDEFFDISSSSSESNDADGVNSAGANRSWFKDTFKKYFSQLPLMSSDEKKKKPLPAGGDENIIFDLATEEVVTPKEVDLLKGDMPLKKGVKGGNDFMALQEGENTYASDARDRDESALDVFEINEDGSSSKTFITDYYKKKQQNYQDIFLSVNEVDYTPNNIIKSLQETIGPYGFVIDNPYQGFAQKAKDTFTQPFNTKIRARNTPVTGEGEEIVSIVSTNGLNTFELKLLDGVPQNKNELRGFMSLRGSNPSDPTPNDEIISKSLNVKQSRTGARFNYETSDYSSVLMTTVEVDDKHLVVPSLFPKDPLNQSTYSEDWIQYDPKTQMDEMLNMARERGEVYAFNTKEEADEFAKGLWKEANTVDLEKQIYFQNNGVENFNQLFKAQTEYEEARDEFFFIDELTKNGLTQPMRNIKRNSNGTYTGDKFIATEEEKALYPNLFTEEGMLRGDYKAYRDRQKLIRDNLYAATQDPNYVAATIAWDVEAAKRREKYTQEAVEINAQAVQSEVILNSLSIEKFGKKIENLPQLINDNVLPPQDVALANFLTAAVTQVDMNKKYAADQFLISKTYLDSKNNKTARGKILKGMWANVSNEWNTRRKRGEAGKVILAMSMTDDPKEMEGVLGMSNSQAAEYISDKLMESYTSSKGSSIEMLEWNRSKGFREKLDVFMDNPLDMGMSLSAGSFSEILPYGIQMVLGTAAVVGGEAFLTTPGGARKKLIATAGGFVTGLQLGSAATLVAMEYTNAAFEAMTLQGYDIASPQSVLKAVQSDEVWQEAREVGLARGIPIAIIDYMTARMAGRLLVGKGDFGWKKFGLLAAERAVVDPAGEAYGEYLAQLNNQFLNNKEFVADEIALEAIGAFGNNTSNMVMNATITAMKNERIIAGERMADPVNYSNMIGNDEQVSNWANSMGELNLLPMETVENIQVNVGNKREAKNLMLMSPDQVTKSDDIPIQTTMMELLSLQNQLSKTPASKSIFGKELSQIKSALNSLAVNKKLDSETLTEVNELSINLFGRPINALQEAVNEGGNLNVVDAEEDVVEEVEVETSPQTEVFPESRMLSREELTIVGNMGMQIAEEKSGLESTIEDINGEIASVKQQLTQDLKNPGLTKDDKINLREEAKSEITSYKEDIAEAKRETRNAIAKLKREAKKQEAGLVGKVAASPDVQLSQQNISELFTNDKTSNTDVVAFSKVPLSAIKDKRIPGGTTRDVYDIGNDRVIKIAKNPRGLQQNASIGYGDLRMLGGLVPNIYEVGTDYIVVEKVPRNDKAVREFLKPLQKYDARDFNIRNRPVELTETMEELGLTDFLNYDLLWNDFKAARNWGQRADGTIVLVDEGALNKNVTATSAIPDWARQEWSEVKRDRKGGSEVSLSQRRIPLPNLLDDYGYDTATGFFPKEITNVGALEKGLQLYGYDLITNTDERTGEITGYHIAQEGSTRKLDLFKGEKLQREARQEAEASPETRKELIELLSKAFPGVKIFDSVEAFEENINKPGIVKRLTKEGYIAYGAKGDGSIYLNPDDKTLSLPLHEFGHMFIDYLKSKRSGEKGSKLYKRGLQLITSTEKGQEEYDKQVKIYGEGNKAREEALVEYIAQEGKRRAGQAQEGKAAKSGLAKWFDLLMNFVRKQFLKLKDLFASKTFAQDIKGMSLEDFVNMTMRELLGGQAVDPNVGVEVEEGGQMRLPSLSQQKAEVPQGTDIEVIVKESRNKGITDVQIKEVLKGRNQFSTEQIQDALAMELIEGQEMPPVFRNLEGGANLGKALFTETYRKVVDFLGKGTTTQIKKQHIDRIKKRFPKATEGLSNQQILNKYPVNKKVLADAKTPAEVRAFAKKELENNPIFASQPELYQEFLTVEFDRVVGITADRNIQKQIRELRSRIQLRRKTERDIQKVKKDLKDFIRLNFPKGLMVPRSVMNRLNKTIADVNKRNYLAQVEKVVAEVDAQNLRIKDSVIQEIKKLVDTNSKTLKTLGNKTRKSSDIDVTTKEFFVAAKEIVDAYLTDNNQFIEDEAAELSILEDAINDALANPDSREKRELVARADAFAVLGDIFNMSLPEIEQVLQDLKDKRSIGREQYTLDSAKRKAEIEKLTEKANTQIQKTNPDLFNEDGTPLNVDNLNQQERKKTLEGFKNKDGGFSFYMSMKGLQNKLLNLDIVNIMKQFKLSAKEALAMGNLLYAGLDARKGNFFSEEMFYRMADATEIFHQINLEKKQLLVDIASGILGKNKFPNAFGRALGFKQLGNITAYQNFKQRAKESVEITLPNVNKQGLDGETSSLFTMGEALRMYAIYQNPRGRRILSADGVDEKAIAKIIAYANKNLPGAIEFVDKVIEYLSTEGYEQANDIHRRIFGVNLPYEENYFPQATESKGQPRKGDDLKIDPTSPLSTINAFSPNSFAERTKQEEDLRMLLGLDFFSVLDNYMEEVSRYEAFAEPAKIIEQLLRIPSVKALLEASGMKNILTYNINVGLDPRGVTRGEDKAKIFSQGTQLMTGYYLGLKAMQIPKQASSYILAYPLYTAGKYSVYQIRKKGDPIFIKNRSVISQIPELLGQIFSNVPSEALTFAEFNAKAAKYLNPINFKETIAKMKKISATVESRILEQEEGNIYSLYSGREDAGLPRGFKKFSNSFQVLQSAFGYFTSIGDIAGVAGYLVVYDALIEQGLSHEDALRVFNDYNLTNQSRRGIDKAGIQTAKSGLSRLFTAFTSSPMQFLSNTYFHSSNIAKDIAQNKTPDMKDVRGLPFNAALASIFFAIVGNIMLLFGNDKDEEEFMRRITEYYGLQALITAIPGMTEAVSLFQNEVDGKGYKKTRTGVTNPLAQFAENAAEAVKREGALGDVNPVVGVAYEILQYFIGVQFTPLEAAVEMAKYDKYFAYNMWLFFGGAPTAFPGDMRPPKGKSKKSNSTKAPSQNTRNKQIQNQRRNSSRRNKR